MVKSIGILVMPTQLAVAIDGCPSERVFTNERAGAEQLIDFVDANIEPAPDGIFVLVASLDDIGPQEPIIEMLHELDLKYSLVLPGEIEEASPRVAKVSGGAVIEAFNLRRSRILGLKPPGN
jgi:hypothetical protein